MSSCTLSQQYSPDYLESHEINTELNKYLKVKINLNFQTQVCKR